MHSMTTARPSTAQHHEWLFGQLLPPLVSSRTLPLMRSTGFGLDACMAIALEPIQRCRGHITPFLSLYNCGSAQLQLGFASVVMERMNHLLSSPPCPGLTFQGG